MIYIYDKVIKEFETKIKRYGAYYTLENKTRMGDQLFYTFESPDREKLLIVPRFAEQYRAVEKLISRFSYCKRFETCVQHVKKEINKEVEIDTIPNDESSTGQMKVIYTRYKDIKIEVQYMNNRVGISPEFEIVDNNIFGNGIVVLMNVNMED